MTDFQRICLVHYHEIGLKGHNRVSFEMRLVKNLQSLLHDFPVVAIHRIAGRLVVFLREGSTLDTASSCLGAIAGVPGVARVSSGFKCKRDMTEIETCAVRALGEVQDFKSFKVQARRSHTDFPVDSMTINRDIGASLCAAFPDRRVQMKSPDVTLGIEVVQNAVYVHATSVRGIGGLPVGSAGKVAVLLSSGIDSPVALWRLARRGAVCIAVHFSGRPQVADTSEYLVADIARVLEQTGCIARVYVVPFGDCQHEISLIVEPSLRVIVYRRLMLRVAERLAIHERALALATGESLGQVASQTLDNIRTTDAAVSLPVFRPLIGSDKIEIIAEAQKLGTFEISSQDAPDCCTLFMPRNPETHATPRRLDEAEAKLPLEEWISALVAAADVSDFSCPAYRAPKEKIVPLAVCGDGGSDFEAADMRAAAITDDAASTAVASPVSS